MLVCTVAEFTFDAKGRSLGRLPDAGKHIELHVSSEGLDQTDGGGALSFSKRSGSDAVSRGPSSPVRQNPGLIQTPTANLHPKCLRRHCGPTWKPLCSLRRGLNEAVMGK